MKKSAEFERSSDFDIRNGKQESDFIPSFGISRIVFARVRSKPGSARMTTAGSGNHRFWRKSLAAAIQWESYANANVSLAAWLRYGRSGLRANVRCLYGHCGDAELTRFVYCLARTPKVTACASCVAIVFLNPQTVALVAYYSDMPTICSVILSVMFPYWLQPCAVSLPK